MLKCREKTWAAWAILLGAWEALALATRRLPTISAIVRSCASRWPVLTRAAVVAWMAALFGHLTDPAEPTVTSGNPELRSDTGPLAALFAFLKRRP